MNNTLTEKEMEALTAIYEYEYHFEVLREAGVIPAPPKN